MNPFRSLARAGALLILLLPTPAATQQLTLLAGGDTEKSPRGYLEPAASAHNPGDWIPIPYLNLEAHREAIRARVGKQNLDEGSRPHHLEATFRLDRTFATSVEEQRYPFLRMLDLLRGADVSFANLEMPLSNARCKAAATCGAPAFADALRWAGLDVLSLANNRSTDAESIGVLDSIDALSRAGLNPVGAGHNLDEARRPLVIDRNGLKVAILAYTHSNSLGIDGFVTPDKSGVMPLDPFLIKEDIQRVRDQVDFVVLSFHWGVQRPEDLTGAYRFDGPMKEERKFAQEMIDAGADIILGHHPHVPKGVEVYKSGVIFYSLGNFTMGHGHDWWLDNFLARLTLVKGAIPQVEILPLAGKGMDIIQPYLLEGDRAQALLRDIQKLSAQLDTPMTIEGNVGVIRPRARQPTGAGR